MLTIVTCCVKIQTYKQPAQSTNKETQLLAYADDIDIVGRSQSAVRDMLT
jgi:hypothetical protein